MSSVLPQTQFYSQDSKHRDRIQMCDEKHILGQNGMQMQPRDLPRPSKALLLKRSQRRIRGDFYIALGLLKKDGSPARSPKRKNRNASFSPPKPSCLKSPRSVRDFPQTKKSVSFRPYVRVDLIPSHRDYDSETREALWCDRQSRQSQVDQNLLQLWSDTSDWRHAVEEAEAVPMSVESQNSTLSNNNAVDLTFPCSVPFPDVVEDDAGANGKGHGEVHVSYSTPADSCDDNSGGQILPSYRSFARRRYQSSCFPSRMDAEESFWAYEPYCQEKTLSTCTMAYSATPDFLMVLPEQRDDSFKNRSVFLNTDRMIPC